MSFFKNIFSKFWKKRTSSTSQADLEINFTANETKILEESADSTLAPTKHSKLNHLLPELFDNPTTKVNSINVKQINSLSDGSIPISSKLNAPVNPEIPTHETFSTLTNVPSEDKVPLWTMSDLTSKEVNFFEQESISNTIIPEVIPTTIIAELKELELKELKLKELEIKNLARLKHLGYR